MTNQAQIETKPTDRETRPTDRLRFASIEAKTPAQRRREAAEAAEAKENEPQ